jgi:hypothetical protein
LAYDWHETSVEIQRNLDRLFEPVEGS